MTATETDLFSLARARRADGIATASEHAGDEWKERALEFLRRYLETHGTLFCDDLWDAGLEEPTSPRALGAVIQTARRRGWIEERKAGGDVLARPSVRSNMQLKRVWNSRIQRSERP